MDSKSYIDPCRNEVYCVPPDLLYSCSSLKVLSLRGCILELGRNVQWNKLKSLTIEGFYISQLLIDRVISGSPQLEVLILNLRGIGYNEGNLSIRSSSLKKLLIERQLDYSDEDLHNDVGPISELVIWSPNVETLGFVGTPFDKYSLVNVSSVTRLTLDFCFVRWMVRLYVREALGEIISAIQQVEKLKISDWCIKVLGVMKEKYLRSPLSNLKSLTINKQHAGDYKEIEDLLQICPKLETLVLKSKRFSVLLGDHGDSFFHDERNFPESFLLQLRTIEITLTKADDLIFPFIENLLKHASKLQKMVFRVKKIKPPSTPLILSQKLLRMPRSSPTAELFFC